MVLLLTFHHSKLLMQDMQDMYRNFIFYHLNYFKYCCAR